MLVKNRALAIFVWLAAAAGWAIIGFWLARVISAERKYEASYFDRVKAHNAIPEYEPGRTVKWNDNENVFFARWSPPEESFRWTASRRCGLLFRLPASYDSSKPDALTIRTAMTIGKQRVRLVVNGRELPERAISGPGATRFVLPPGLLLPQEINVIEINLPDARRVDGDSRVLGLALVELRLRGSGKADGGHALSGRLIYFDSATGNVQMNWLELQQNESQAKSVSLRRVEQPGWNLAGAAIDGSGTLELIWQEESSRQVIINCVDADNGHLNSWRWLNNVGRPQWRVVALADVDGDGTLDVVWQHERTLQVEAESTSGSAGPVALQPASPQSESVPPWRVVAAADFNSDGRAELIWENQVTLELRVGMSPTGAGSRPLPFIRRSSNWKIAGVADVNGDGMPDAVWEDGDKIVTSLSGPSQEGAPPAVITPRARPAQWHLVVAGFQS
jgi:hypothetical protein